MNSILFRFSELEMLILSVKSKTLQIDTSTNSVPSASNCSGIVVDEYIKRIKQISGLLDKYKLLVEKDMQEVSEAQNVLKKADVKAKINILAKK